MKILNKLAIMAMTVALSSCGGNSPEDIKNAEGYCTQALGIMLDREKSQNSDSLNHALALITKAIELDGDKDQYYLLKGFGYMVKNERDSTLFVLEERWKESQENFVIALSVGAIYEMKQDAKNAITYYHQAKEAIEKSSYDEENSTIIINKKMIERMMTDTISFDDVKEKLFRGPDSLKNITMAKRIEKGSRLSLLNLILGTR